VDLQEQYGDMRCESAYYRQTTAARPFQELFSSWLRNYCAKAGKKGGGGGWADEDSSGFLFVLIRHTQLTKLFVRRDTNTVVRANTPSTYATCCLIYNHLFEENKKKSTWIISRRKKISQLG
jgi:hypothetical protein